MINRWIVTTFAALLLAQSAWSSDNAAQAEIEAARQQLDEAARHLAELHRKYAAEQGRDYSIGIGDRPMLGVLLGGLAADGVPIAGVTPGSGAEEAGLIAGDVIIAIDGLDLSEGGIAGMRLLRGAIADLTPGDTVSIEYLRDGGSNLATVTTREESHHVRNMIEAPRMPQAMSGTIAFGRPGAVPGLRLHDLGPELGRYFGTDAGVLVLSAANLEGLEPGDVIREMDGQPVAHMGEVMMTIARSTGALELSLLRDGGYMTVSVQPGQGGWYGGEYRAIQVIETGDRAAPVDVEILTNN